jgi:hypothetical protein
MVRCGGHAAFQYEDPIRSEVGGRVLEAAHLLVLVQQVADGVEHQVHEGVGAVPGASPVIVYGAALP